MATILIIDDDELILDVCRISLNVAGHQVFTAPGGSSGLELVRRHRPDVVLCDINMPDVDGWTLLNNVRQSPELAATQLVLITGNTHLNSPRAGMERGADDFLNKPFGDDDILRCIEARLRRAELNRRLATRATSELRTSLHASLPHELFTPLSGIIGLVVYLRDAPDLPPSEREELLRDVEGSAQRLHRTLRNYLYTFDLDSLPPSPTRCAVSAPAITLPALREAASAAARRHHREADLELRLAPPALAFPPDELALVVEELVDNACAYSRPGTAVVVHLGPDGVLAIRDHGRGMSDAQIRQIDAFQQFDRKRHEQQGLGLGLYLARKLATHRGATFAIESSPASGTRVLLSLPIYDDSRSAPGS